MQKIQFGTDGWRAIIADDFTFDNVRAVAQAYAGYMKERFNNEAQAAIGYDTRFLSAEFGRAFAEVLASNRIHVLLSPSHIPTPVLAHAVKHRALEGGVMITASHNPPQYNGIKFKDIYGGPVLDREMKRIEAHLYREAIRRDSNLINRYLEEADFLDDYKAHLKQYLNLSDIRTMSNRVVIATMHGAATGIWQYLTEEMASPLAIVQNTIHPLFSGRPPEPIMANLKTLRRAVRKKNAELGIAFDGDADRLGVVDGEGEFVQLHDLMPMLFEYLIKSRNGSGTAIRTTSMADTIDRMAEQHGMSVREVPVGFKHVTERMLDEDVLIGGEESGGFGYKNHLPERDGLLSALLVLEMLGTQKTTIREKVKELRQRFGPFAYKRIDHYYNTDILSANLEVLRSNPPAFIGKHRVQKVTTVDGIKFYFDDDSWMLIRVSQTEPLARVYVGSHSEANADAIISEGKKRISGDQKVR